MHQYSQLVVNVSGRVLPQVHINVRGQWRNASRVGLVQERKALNSWGLRKLTAHRPEECSTTLNKKLNTAYSIYLNTHACFTY